MRTRAGSDASIACSPGAALGIDDMNRSDAEDWTKDTGMDGKKLKYLKIALGLSIGMAALVETLWRTEAPAARLEAPIPVMVSALSGTS